MSEFKCRPEASGSEISDAEFCLSSPKVLSQAETRVSIFVWYNHLSVLKGSRGGEVNKGKWDPELAEGVRGRGLGRAAPARKRTKCVKFNSKSGGMGVRKQKTYNRNCNSMADEVLE